MLDEIHGIFKLRTDVLETLEIKLENIEKNNSDIVFLNSIKNKIQELSLFFFFKGKKQRKNKIFNFFSFSL